MKVKLSIPERILLMGVMPEEGSFLTLKVIRDTASLLGIKDDEFKRYGLKQDGNQITWNVNEKINEEKEFELGEKATELIVEALEKLDKEKKLTQQQFSLFEKFVKGGDG